MRSKIEDYRETSEPVARVLSRLRGVRRLCRGHYQAPCPLHPNHMITVSETVDGRALLKCEAGSWLYPFVPTWGGRKVKALFRRIDVIYPGNAAPAYPTLRAV